MLQSDAPPLPESTGTPSCPQGRLRRASLAHAASHAKLRHLAAQADYIKSSFLAYHQPFGRIEYDVSMLYGAVEYICRLAEDAEADSVPEARPEMLQTPGSRRPQLNVSMSDEPGSPLREVSSLGSIVSLDSG